MSKRLVPGTDAVLLQPDGGLEVQNLDASAGVFTDADKALTSTAPTSGVLGYWDRTGVNVSPATAADTLETDGGRIANTTRVTNTYTALVTDEVIFCDTDGGAWTLTLPAGVEGTHYKIINCGSSGNALTVDGDGVETVWGQATATLNDGDILDLHYNATEGWW